jgi:hypothetical protein
MCFLASSLSAGLKIGLPGTVPRACMMPISFSCADLYLGTSDQAHESFFTCV